MPNLLDTLGRRVRAARLARGQTLKELAETSGLSVRFIGQLEGGQGNISVGRLAELADALDLPIASLLAPNDGLLLAAEPHVRYLAEAPAPDPAAEAAVPTGAIDRGSRLRRLLERLEPLDPLTLSRVEAAVDGVLRSEPPAVVALLGVRGAGKSTVGRRVARALGLPFIELDHRIEEAAGLSLEEIFAIHGEPLYRRLEREVLDAFLSEARPCVLATGGSLVTHDECWEPLRARALTLWLHAEAREHWERLLAQGDDRPMRRNPQAFSQLEAMLAAREPLYQKAHARVETTGRSIEAVVEEVVSLVRRARLSEWRGPRAGDGPDA